MNEFLHIRTIPVDYAHNEVPLGTEVWYFDDTYYRADDDKSFDALLNHIFSDYRDYKYGAIHYFTDDVMEIMHASPNLLMHDLPAEFGAEKVIING